MQAQLFISSALLVFASAPSSLACGSESPDQVPSPQFSVQERDDRVVLKFHDKTARTIFDHLRDPQVRRFTSDFYQLKTGFGIICVGQTGLQQYECFQEFDVDGEVQGFFTYSNELKSSASWLQLNLKSPAMATIYNKLTGQALDDIEEKTDGSMAMEKQRTRISCTNLVTPEGASSFSCSQLLSAGGLPIGPGSDPVIGSGTHPVALDIEEGANP